MAYQRKTADVFVIQGNYGQGWEDVTEEDDRPAGRVQLRCYRDNEPQFAHRMIVRRVPIGGATDGR
jgi:hypothetical protein